MKKEILKIRGISRSHPDDTDCRTVNFGVDAPWPRHEAWLVPEPITPEAGEMWSKEDVDYCVAVLKQIFDEAYSDPELVKSAPHNQAVHKLGPASLDEPDNWAMTWRAYQPQNAAAAD